MQALLDPVSNAMSQSLSSNLHHISRNHKVDLRDPEVIQALFSFRFLKSTDRHGDPMGFSLDQLAKLTGYSSSHLSTWFRKMQAQYKVLCPTTK